MNNTELDTFIYKFKHLWKAGLDAHLDLECCAGKAWVGLRFRLGQESGHLHHHPFIPPQPSRTRDAMVPQGSDAEPGEQLPEKIMLKKQLKK